MNIKTILTMLVALSPAVSLAGVLDEPQPRRYIIQDDGGGGVEEYKSSLSYLSKEGMAIKLDGSCASSCTLIMSTKYKLDVCITEKASLEVHKPYALNFMGQPMRTVTAIAAAERMWKGEFFNNYPTWLKTAILARGDVPSVMQGDSGSLTIDLVYDDLKPFMKVCDD